jgi:hypothetical protein
MRFQVVNMAMDVIKKILQKYSVLALQSRVKGPTGSSLATKQAVVAEQVLLSLQLCPCRNE